MRHALFPGAVSAIAKIGLTVKKPLSAAVCLEEIPISQREEGCNLVLSRGGNSPLTDKGVNRMP